MNNKWSGKGAITYENPIFGSETELHCEFPNLTTAFATMASIRTQCIQSSSPDLFCLNTAFLSEDRNICQVRDNMSQ